FRDGNNSMKKSISLNATIYSFFRELKGFHGMGQGVLKLPVYDVKDMHFVKCNFDDIRPSLLQREQSSIFIECGIDPKGETWIEEQKPKPLPDRIELDDIVFDAIGLSRGERDAVYEAVIDLVGARLKKASSLRS
ncbi:MAG: hypothetical protein J7M40_15910, partial [Planctomycetes bacterium]|nr:hypothetical protein [Planctomycetota bacterium]